MGRGNGIFISFFSLFSLFFLTLNRANKASKAHGRVSFTRYYKPSAATVNTDLLSPYNICRGTLYSGNKDLHVQCGILIRTLYTLYTPFTPYLQPYNTGPE